MVCWHASCDRVFAEGDTDGAKDAMVAAEDIIEEVVTRQQRETRRAAGCCADNDDDGKSFESYAIDADD